VIVSRLDDDRLEVLRSARNAQAAVSRTRRVASSRRRADQQASLNKRENAAEEAENELIETEAVEADAVETETVETEDHNGVALSDVDETTVELDSTDQTVSEDTTEETDK
jgi:hypothetical protein